MQVRALLSIILLCLPIMANAQCAKPQSRYTNLSCAIEAVNESNSDMQSVIARLEKTFNNKQKKAFEKSQEAWVNSLRQRLRTIPKEGGGGSSRYLILMNKVTDLTEQRIRELRATLRESRH